MRLCPPTPAPPGSSRFLRDRSGEKGLGRLCLRPSSFPHSRANRSSPRPYFLPGPKTFRPSSTSIPALLLSVFTAAGGPDLESPGARAGTPGHGQPGPEDLPALRQPRTPRVFRAAESCMFKDGEISSLLTTDQGAWKLTFPADPAPCFLKESSATLGCH